MLIRQMIIIAENTVFNRFNIKSQNLQTTHKKTPPCNLLKTMCSSKNPSSTEYGTATSPFRTGYISYPRLPRKLPVRRIVTSKNAGLDWVGITLDKTPTLATLWLRRTIRS